MGRAVLKGGIQVFQNWGFAKKPRVAHTLHHGWLRLVVGGWWRLAAVGGWRLVAVGGWRLAVGGGWLQLAVGGWWRLSVGGWRSLGAVLCKKKNWVPSGSAPACGGGGGGAELVRAFVRSWPPPRVHPLGWG